MSWVTIIWSMVASACLTRAGRFWLAAAICFLLVLETRAAQSSFRADPSFLIDTWETEDGLPENSATAMVQTSDGYLWFGTFNGLVRFDGVKFTVFNPANTPELPSAGIVNLHLDQGGRLWISTLGGLVAFEGKQWRAFGTNEGWAGNFVRTFAERASGDLLMTTFDGHVLEFVNGRFAPLPAPPGTPGQGYFAHGDEAGQWWVVQNRFVGHWDGQRRIETVRLQELVADAIRCGTAPDGSLLLVVRQELRRYRRGAEVSRAPLAELPGAIWSVFEDSRTNVWIVTYDQGLCRVRSDCRQEVTDWRLNTPLSRMVLRIRHGSKPGWRESAATGKTPRTCGSLDFMNCSRATTCSGSARPTMTGYGTRPAPAWRSPCNRSSGKPPGSGSLSPWSSSALEPPRFRGGFAPACGARSNVNRRPTPSATWPGA
jgi:hypothetical protein